MVAPQKLEPHHIAAVAPQEGCNTSRLCFVRKHPSNHYFAELEGSPKPII